MPVNESVQRALSEVDKDESKVLGLTVDKHSPKLGTYIPKAGECFTCLSPSLGNLSRRIRRTVPEISSADV
jgi:hypothetical protein